MQENAADGGFSDVRFCLPASGRWLRRPAARRDRSGKSFETGARSRGANTSYHEISRPLIRREELMNDCRTDEAFVIIRGARPLRCGRAIYFRRPELEARVTANRFNKTAAATAE